MVNGKYVDKENSGKCILNTLKFPENLRFFESVLENFFLQKRCRLPKTNCVIFNRKLYLSSFVELILSSFVELILYLILLLEIWLKLKFIYVCINIFFYEILTYWVFLGHFSFTLSLIRQCFYYFYFLFCYFFILFYQYLFESWQKQQLRGTLLNIYVFNLINFTKLYGLLATFVNTQETFNVVSTLLLGWYDVATLDKVKLTLKQRCVCQHWNLKRWTRSNQRCLFQRWY